MAAIMNLLKALVLAVLLLLSPNPFDSAIKAQTRDPSLRPLLQEGQMFTVRIVPAAGLFKVYVVGKEVAQMEMADVGLKAYVRVGEDMEPLAETYNNEYFVIRNESQEASELKLEVRYKGTVEQFSFNIK